MLTRQNDNDEYWTYDDEWWCGNRGAYVSENQIIQTYWSESIDFKIGESFLVLDLTFLFIALTNF